MRFSQTGGGSSGRTGVIVMGVNRTVILFLVCLAALSFTFPQKAHRKPAVKKAAVQSGSAYGPNDFPIRILDGRSLRLSSFAGRIVLVTIFSPSCVPCSAETPGLRSVYDEYHGRGFDILGVGVQTGETELRLFIQKQNISWSVGINDTLPRQFGMYGLPDHYLFARDGTLVNHYVGFLRSPILRSALDTLMSVRRQTPPK